MAVFARRVRVFVIGALAFASLSGGAVHAEEDLLPPISQLFGWNARADRRVEAPTSCGPGGVEVASPEQQARRQAALARLSALMQAQASGGGEVLNNRGYAYPTNRDPRAELLRVEMEARRARAERAGKGG